MEFMVLSKLEVVSSSQPVVSLNLNTEKSK
ncbi:hypothetical protein ES705_26811 [subsurface metagenome]